MSQTDFLGEAGLWLLESGIQEPGGGVARYYRADKCANLAVSTEITGYAVSALVYLHSLTGEARYLDAARQSASFLTDVAWDRGLRLFPFEVEGAERFAYFFDCGIIVRSLLALWRATGDGALLEVARECGRSMASEFAAGGGEYHPILRIPEKQPVSRSDQWSRSPGCYQLKSALAWHNLHQATGESGFLDLYEGMLAWSMRNHESFLPGVEGERVMDRLHAYSYFLEAVMPRAGRPDVAAALASGIGRVERYLGEIGPQFARSDVYAQLLRVRLMADSAGAVPLDRTRAAAEAGALGAFQAEGGARRIRGGFYFARRGGRVQPHVNPVSTSFGLQALAMWRQRLAGERRFSIDALI
jgi:hypothetical protein